MVRRTSTKPETTATETTDTVEKPKRTRVPLPSPAADLSFDTVDQDPGTRTFAPSEALLNALRASHKDGKGRQTTVAALGGDERVAEQSIRKHAALVNLGVKVRFPGDGVVRFWAQDKVSRPRKAKVEAEA